MSKQTVAIATATVLCLSGCATNYAAAPQPSSDETIRYTQGIPTVFSDKPGGSVQVTPAGYIKEDKRLIFATGVFNKGTAPANFGLEGVHVTWNGVPLRTYTRDELAHEAKVKAEWLAVAAVLAGAAAAYAANQNAYHNTYGYASGPGGTVTFQAHSYDPAAAAIGTAAAGAATGYTLASIQGSLDGTIANLNGSILQTNTIDPGRSDGGEVVVDLPDSKTFPQPVTLTVDWQGATHVFQFIVDKTKD